MKQKQYDEMMQEFRQKLGNLYNEISAAALAAKDSNPSLNVSASFYEDGSIPYGMGGFLEWNSSDVEWMSSSNC